MEHVAALSSTPTVTFCSVHIHIVVTQKRDASTELLRRIHGYMQQHDVDFIGGDFNMGAFSADGDVFAERTGFLIMPKRPYEWRVDSNGCYTFKYADLPLGPRDSSAHFPVFLHLRTINLQGPDSITRSEQAQQR